MILRAPCGMSCNVLSLTDSTPLNATLFVSLSHTLAGAPGSPRQSSLPAPSASRSLSSFRRHHLTHQAVNLSSRSFAVGVFLAGTVLLSVVLLNNGPDNAPARGSPSASSASVVTRLGAGFCCLCKPLLVVPLMFLCHVLHSFTVLHAYFMFLQMT